MFHVFIDEAERVRKLLAQRTHHLKWHALTCAIVRTALPLRRHSRWRCDEVAADLRRGVTQLRGSTGGQRRRRVRGTRGALAFECARELPLELREARAQRLASGALGRELRAEAVGARALRHELRLQARQSEQQVVLALELLLEALDRGEARGGNRNRLLSGQ